MTSSTGPYGTGRRSTEARLAAGPACTGSDAGTSSASATSATPAGRNHVRCPRARSGPVTRSRLARPAHFVTPGIDFVPSPSPLAGSH